MMCFVGGGFSFLFACPRVASHHAAGECTRARALTNTKVLVRHGGDDDQHRGSVHH
jgi:hypothetical protein